MKCWLSSTLPQRQSRDSLIFLWNKSRFKLKWATVGTQHTSMQNLSFSAAKVKVFGCLNLISLQIVFKRICLNLINASPWFIVQNYIVCSHLLYWVLCPGFRRKYTHRYASKIPNTQIICWSDFLSHQQIQQLTTVVSLKFQTKTIYYFFCALLQHLNFPFP